MSENNDESKGCLLLVLIIIGMFLFNHYFSNDGKRCAYVSIYNPKTGTDSYYDLQVEISDNEVVKIYFENGGLIDESHFKGDNLLNGDYASFKDDRGREISVIIKDDNDCD